MSLRGDDRAQSVQVGAVILFGFLVLAMAGYQATVVPAENEQLEFRHTETVQEDMTELRNAVLGTGLGGDAAPPTVSLGLRYPDRVFFANPPPVAGELRTGPERTIWINGTALAEPDANDAWNSSSVSLSTRALIHEAEYYENGQRPRNRIEHGLLYTRYADANVSRTDQPVMSGNRITLVTVNGSLSQSGSGTTTVDLDRLSVSTSETTLEAGSNPTLFLPAVNASVWERAVEENPAVDDSYVVNVNTSVSGGVLLELEPNETYRLRLAQVGVGSGTDDPEPAYVTPVSGDGATVVEGGTTRLTVEVRDEFNNPVSGSRVNATVVGPAGGEVDAVGSATSDDEGRVTLRYEAPEDIDYNRTKSVDVRVSVDTTGGALRGEYDPRTPLNATVNLTVSNTDASGLLGYVVDWDTDAMTDQNGVTYAPENETLVVDRTTVDGEIDATVNTTPTTDGVSVRLSTGNSSVADFSAAEVTTDQSGTATTSLAVSEPGETFVVATSASDDDRLRVDVRGNERPSVDTVTVTRDGNGAQIEWTVSDAEDFSAGGTVNVTVFDSTDTTVHQEFTSVSTSPASGSTTTGTLDRNEQHRIVVTVEDGVGARDSAEDTYTRTGGGNSGGGNSGGA